MKASRRPRIDHNHGAHSLRPWSLLCSVSEASVPSAQGEKCRSAVRTARVCRKVVTIVACGPSVPSQLILLLWLTACGVTTVAMESTCVYWIPVFEMLEERGMDNLSQFVLNALKSKLLDFRKRIHATCVGRDVVRIPSLTCGECSIGFPKHIQSSR